MSEFLLGILSGFIFGVILVLAVEGDAITFYSKYKTCSYDIDCLKSVTQLQIDAAK